MTFVSWIKETVQDNVRCEDRATSKRERRTSGSYLLGRAIQAFVLVPLMPSADITIEMT